MPWPEEGIQETDCYFKSEVPSPCAPCERLRDDKSLCSLECEKLERWQLETGALTEANIKNARLRVDGNRGCPECDGTLIYEDGVIFCLRCLSVYMRGECRDQDQVVEYLCDRDWAIDEIGELLAISEERVAQIVRALGMAVVYGYDEGERKAIVDFMLSAGMDAAVDRFGIKKETINKYAREFGLGTAQRFGKLKAKALKMYAKGKGAGEVCRKLGINYSTARRWRARK